MPALNIDKPRLLQAFASLTRRARAKPDGWPAAVEQVMGQLEELNRSTERDFLSVGEKLMGFRTASRQISSDMALLAELISGEQGNSAGVALERILEHSRAMNTGVGESGQALESVRDLARQLRVEFLGIPQMVSVLRNQCTLTRIETARLGNSSAEFGDLAADVSPLSASIQSSGIRVVEAASRLDSGVLSAIRTASILHVRQRQELPPLIASVTGSIQAFAERQRRARDASIRQTVQYEALCEAINGLVTNIQFHDITRQQIEHVVEALGQARFLKGPQARSVLTLQALQLSNSSRVFAAAVDGIERDLEGIAGRLRSMAETSRTLLGASETDHDSFFLRMEAGFTTILQAMNACDEAQAEIQAATAQIQRLAEEMRISIGEIRGLELRIQRIAINASIRAIHIGDGGDPLAVIAEEMQRLVAGSSNHTEDASRSLEAIREAARHISGAGACSGADQVSGQMQQAILEMQSASELSYSRVNEIAELGARLAADIALLRGGFSAGALFAGVVSRAAAEVERIAAEIPAGESAAPPELLDLATNYTMQAERDVHESMMQAAETALPEPDTLGDNVELF